MSGKKLYPLDPCAQSSTFDPMQFDEFDEFTRKLCFETQKAILALYESPDLKVETKDDLSPVTMADKEVEREIREAIQVLYPEHGFKGEEFGDINSNASFTWVVDPIDGTKTFTAGCPLFGTMIALLSDGEPIFGCINFPALGKRISSDSNSTYVNGAQVRASTSKPLEEALLLTTDHSEVAKHQKGPAFENLVARARLTRTWGDCYGYYLLATGNAEIMLDPIMNAWDIMALIPIIRGSGATITDWAGENPSKGNSIIAASKNLHSEVVEILNS